MKHMVSIRTVRLFHQNLLKSGKHERAQIVYVAIHALQFAYRQNDKAMLAQGMQLLNQAGFVYGKRNPLPCPIRREVMDGCPFKIRVFRNLKSSGPRKTATAPTVSRKYFDKPHGLFN